MFRTGSVKKLGRGERFFVAPLLRKTERGAVSFINNPWSSQVLCSQRRTGLIDYLVQPLFLSDKNLFRKRSPSFVSQKLTFSNSLTGRSRSKGRNCQIKSGSGGVVKGISKFPFSKRDLGRL